MLDVNDVVMIISKRLMDSININDEKLGINQFNYSTTTAFFNHCNYDISNLLQSICREYGIGTLVLTYWYVGRLTQEVILCTTTAYFLVLSSINLALKFNEDGHFSFQVFNGFPDVSNDKLGALEKKSLEILEFKLYCSTEQYLNVVNSISFEIEMNNNFRLNREMKVGIPMEEAGYDTSTLYEDLLSDLEDLSL